MIQQVFYILAEPVTLAAALWSLFCYAAISVGMYYLSQALWGQDLKEAEEPVSARDRMWAPRTTQQEGLARARCYGKNLHHSNIIARWTDVDGDEREILYLLLEHGDGPTKGNVADKIWFNDQPLTNFGDDVSVQERKGTMDQTCMTGFEHQKLEYGFTNTELKEADGAYIWTSPNKFSDDLEYTICFPNGLIKHAKDGSHTHPVEVHMHIKIRENPDGAWNTLLDADIWGQTATPIFKKYVVSEQGFNVEQGKHYDIQFENTSVLGASRLIRNVFLRSVREVVHVPFTRPGKALTGIRAISTSLLSGRVDVKIIREDRLVWTWNGTEAEIKHTRNRAWITWDILTLPEITGDVGTWAISKFEGTLPENLDLEFFYNWAAFCETQVLDGYGGTEDRLACDVKLETQTDLWSLVRDISQVGRANLWWAGNKLTGWIDKQVSSGDITDIVTMDSTMARSWHSGWVGKDELAGIVSVAFDDSRSGYEHVVIPFPRAGAGNYKRMITIEGVGITTYGTAAHVANHALTRNELINNINTFQQPKEAFRHTLGEVIRLQQKLPKWGQGYRVKECLSGSVLELDRYIADVNPDDLLYVRTYNEETYQVETSVYTVVSTSGRQVTISETFDPWPAKNNNAAIGVSGAIVLRRITKLEPLATNYFEVEVETYDTDLFLADDLDPNAPNQGYIWGQPPGAIVKPVTPDQVVDLINQLLPPSPDIEIPWPSNLAWTGDEVDTVTWAADDADDPITFRLKGTSYEITADDTTDEFIYWDPNFTTTFQTTNSVATATTAGRFLMCRNIDGVAYPTNAMMLAQIGVLYAGFLQVGTADIVNLAVTTLKIKDNAVTLPMSAYTEGAINLPGATWTDVIEITFPCEGGTLFLNWSLLINKNADDAAQKFIKVYRDAVQIYTSVIGAIGDGNPVASYVHSACIEDDPGVGEFIYKVKAYINVGNVHTASNRFLYIHELKK